MRFRFVIALGLLLGSGGWSRANAQIPSFCPEAASFSVVTSGNSVSIYPPVTTGWDVFFSNVPAPAVSDHTVTARVLSQFTTNPTVARPPVVFNGLDAGTYTVLIDRAYSPPTGFIPFSINCVPLTTSSTFVIVGTPVIATPVPAISSLGALALLCSLAGAVFFSTRARRFVCWQ